jgi:hypothetical protein
MIVSGAATVATVPTAIAMGATTAATTARIAPAITPPMMAPKRGARLEGLLDAVHTAKCTESPELEDDVAR